MRQSKYASTLLILMTSCTTPSLTPTITAMPSLPPTKIPSPAIAHTSTKTITETTTLTITPSPSSTPTPVPWSLDDAIAKLPEVYTGSVSPDTVEQYAELLYPLPENVQRWIVSMGWGMENLFLDTNEIALLESLSEKNIPTVMSIMTKPSIIDGVNWNEVKWARDYDVENVSLLIQDDLDELEEKELISKEAIAGIAYLVDLANNNYEIVKGLFLIDNFGHPNQNLFWYPVPEYNTQLYILGRLIEQGIPEGYEVTALATALDYGTLWTIANEEVRSLILEYALGMLNFQVETDQIISNEGADWKAAELPLEAQILLVWGGPGNYRTISYERATRLRLRKETDHIWRGYRELFTREQFDIEEWNWGIVSITYLEEIRERVINDNLIINSPSRFANRLIEYWYEELLQYNDEGLEREIDGETYFLSYLTNMNFQWERLKGEHGVNRKFVGTSGDAFIAVYLGKSINYPVIQQSFLSHLGAVFNSSNNSLIASQKEFWIDNSQPEDAIDSRIGWNLVPWENFFIQVTKHYDNWSGRVRILRPMPKDVWLEGMPIGYIYRADVSVNLGAWP